MIRTSYLAAVVCCCLPLAPAAAADLKLLPAEATLTGPHARQHLLVLTEKSGQFVGDHTRQAKFTSSQPAVASVGEAGVVKAVSDGEAVVTATHDGEQATARIKVV